jgi:phage shock protein PspC (stress-responsive transcriptional regulator)
MRRLDWQTTLGLALIALSAIVYFIHYLIFRDAHHIFIYMIGDIAFVFIEVLMVTLIIHQLLSLRAKRSILEKLNMVIGAFFSEVGTRLLKDLSALDPKSEAIRSHLVWTADSSDTDFSGVRKLLEAHDYAVEAEKGALEDLKAFLIAKRDFLLRVLENPNLLEHESFTDLLWAVFHLTEELAHREDVKELPESDYVHLAGDMQRAYTRLSSEWLAYMNHLRENYPYLFSLAMRTNPFDLRASLYRSREDRMVAGICGGIGESYNIDPTVVRLAVVFLGLATGVMPVLVAYIIGIFIIPLGSSSQGNE